MSAGEQQAAVQTGESPPSGFIALAQARRSIRRYQATPVSRAQIEQVLGAAHWAPSAHNRQPWRFCVVTSPAVQRRLADGMAAAWRRDLLRDGLPPEEADARVETRRQRLLGAPVLVLAALSLEEMDAYPDERRQQAEWTMAVQSAALACQNLLLAAHDLGLGACWMCAPLFVPDLVRELLDLPAAWQPQALITLGYPAETRTKERAPLATRVIWK
jgi:F420 biosynthesis protein FbiB-like protein